LVTPTFVAARPPSPFSSLPTFASLPASVFKLSAAAFCFPELLLRLLALTALVSPVFDDLHEDGGDFFSELESIFPGGGDFLLKLESIFLDSGDFLSKLESIFPDGGDFLS
jgi:hypothetical protein